MADMQTVTGGCHCGTVRYEADADLGQAMVCNCSHCEKKGFILTFTPVENFRLLSGGDRLAEYRFNQNKIGHRFCAVCGTQAFAFGSMPDGTPMVAINIRCIDGVDQACRLSRSTERACDRRETLSARPPVHWPSHVYAKPPGS